MFTFFPTNWSGLEAQKMPLDIVVYVAVCWFPWVFFFAFVSDPWLKDSF